MQGLTPELGKIIKYMLGHGKLEKYYIVDANELKDKNPGDYDLPHEITDVLLDNIHYVEHFKSDVLIDIDTIRRDIVKHSTSTNIVAMRRSGVDGNDFFMSRLNDFYRTNNYTALSDYYRRVFVVFTHKIRECDIDDLDYHDFALSRYNVGDTLIAIFDASCAIPSASIIS